MIAVTPVVLDKEHSSVEVQFIVSGMERAHGLHVYVHNRTDLRNEEPWWNASWHDDGVMINLDGVYQETCVLWVVITDRLDYVERLRRGETE